jgi:competence protein ComEC
VALNSSRRDPVEWFVRRAGLARFSTAACALGLSLAVVAGCRLGPALAGLAVTLSVLCVGLLGRQGRWGRRVLVLSVLLCGLFSGCVLGTLRATALSHSGLLPRVGQTVEVELTVTGPVRGSAGWQSATASIRRLESDAVGEPIWLEVPPESGEAGQGGSPPRLRQGMILSCRATVRAPEEQTASGYDQSKRLLQEGIGIVLRVRDPGSIVLLGQRGGVSGWFDGLRRGAQEHLDLGPASRINKVLQGVVMGDTAGIDQGWLEAFRRSGTAHMLSVSGLHVASLAAIVVGLARLLGAARWVGFLLAVFSAVFMIPFVGPSPPIIRAAVMIVVVTMGRWVGRGRDQWQVLALAAVVILALNPFGVYDVGFQLSFSALAGILALTGPLQRLLKRLPAAIAANVSVSLAASVGTAPFALAAFGRTSVVSPFANLLVVPCLPVVTGFGMASAILGFVWSGFSVGLDTMASLPMIWVVFVSGSMAHAPVLTSEDIGRTVAVLAGVAAVLPMALALTGHVVKTPFGLPLPFMRSLLARLCARRPRNRRRGQVLAVGLLILATMLSLVLYPLAVRGAHGLQGLVGVGSWPRQVEVRVLDVGQGNAVLVRTPGHHALLFDGGPEDCGLAGQLRALGVRKLDLVVISHPHADHFAGLLDSISDLEVVAIADHVQVVAPALVGSASEDQARVQPGIAAGGGEEARQYLRLRRRLTELGCRYAFVETGYCACVDGVAVDFFAPEHPLVLVDGREPWVAMGGEPTGDELNDASLVAVVRADRWRVLLPGDAEAEALARYDLPNADVLMVPHHGSQGSVSERLLNTLGSRVGIISAGAGNPFGHPFPGTVSFLERRVDSVIRTDTAGWVSCTLERDRIAITTERTPTR